MSIWDDRILEYISKNSSSYAAELSKCEYIHVTSQHISRRLSTLAEHGLLAKNKKGVYSITQAGTDYIMGRYDAERDEPTESEFMETQMPMEKIAARLLQDLRDHDIDTSPVEAELSGSTYSPEITQKSDQHIYELTESLVETIEKNKKSE